MNQLQSPVGISRRNNYQTRKRVREDELGEVVRAVQIDMGREVALLQLDRSFHRVPEETLQRLRMAAAEAQTLEHPSVVQVVDFQLDRKDKDLFIAMTFVNGETLRNWLVNRPAGVSLSTAAKIVADLADALHHVKENGRRWVHPVVDPDKIIITQKQIGRTDHPVMVDLGFVHLFSIYGDAASEPTAREQGDIHALGILFFDLLNGGFPSEYGRVDLRFVEQRQVELGVNELVQRLNTAPPTLWAILRRTLAVDPAQRFADLAEFGRELRALVQTALTVDAPLTVIPQPAPSPDDPAPASQTDAPQAALQMGDRLILLQHRGEGRVDTVGEHPLRKEVITIGAYNSDITLAKISSQRLILLRQDRPYGRYYTISEAVNGDSAFGKTSPIYLNRILLAPDYAAVLTEDSELSVDGYSLVLRVDPAHRASQMQNTQALELASKAFTVAPDETLAIPITVRNTTNEVGRFGIVLHGAPDAWVVDRVESRRLNAGEIDELTVRIKLPSVSLATARTYPLIVRAISRVLDAQVAAVVITVEVRPVDDVAATLEPESLRAGRQGVVYILNRGNSARVVRVQWRNRADELVFEPADAVIPAPPDEPVQLGFRAYVREPRWFGMEKRHSINVLVAPQDGGLAHTLPGEVVSRALIPGWLLPLVVLIVLLVLLISTFLLQPEFAARAVEVAGTPIFGQPVADKNMKLTWTPINSCFYSVYKDGTAFKWLIWNWQAQRVSVEILDEAPGAYEVRLRGCLLLGEKSWQVNIAPAPTSSPAPTPLPEIAQFDVSSTDVLLGDQGDICFEWEVTSRVPDLRIAPDIGAVSPEAGRKCIPIAQVLRNEGETSYRLVATFGEQQVVSPEVKVTARRAACTQNTTVPLFVREGPGAHYPERGQLAPGAVVYPLARSFTPYEQDAPEPWLQVTVSLDDPRPAWVAFAYLSCPDLSGLPVPNLIPPTPTPAPTVTPTPTPTATPALTPMVSISPEVIREGECTMVKWDIQGVDKVFLNGGGIVGVGEQQICNPPKGTHIFTWKIIQRDGGIVELTRSLIVNAAPP